jgi:hypothetical protein
MVDGSAAVVVAIDLLREVQYRRQRVDEAELRGAAGRGPNEYVASSPGSNSVVAW